MATEIGTYEVRFFGGPEGHLKSRAQITLYDEDDERIGFIRFKDPGMEWQEDVKRGTMMFMYLPTTMFPSVVDILRNEKPVSLHFASNKCFLSTGKEAAGEGELDA